MEISVQLKKQPTRFSTFPPHFPAHLYLLLLLLLLLLLFLLLPLLLFLHPAGSSSSSPLTPPPTPVTTYWASRSVLPSSLSISLQTFNSIQSHSRPFSAGSVSSMPQPNGAKLNYSIVIYSLLSCHEWTTSFNELIRFHSFVCLGKWARGKGGGKRARLG